MPRTGWVIVLAAVLAMALALASPAHAKTTRFTINVNPTLDNSVFLMVWNKKTKTWSIVPEAFRITFYANPRITWDDHKCWPWDTSMYKYTYTVVVKRLGPVTPINPVLSYGGATIVTSIYYSLSLAPFITKGWLGFKWYENAYVTFNTEILLRWAEPPQEPMSVDVGRLLARGRDTIVVQGIVDVTRTNGQETARVTLTLNFKLNMRGLKVHVVELKVLSTKVTLNGYTRIDPLGLAPRGNIETILKLVGDKEASGIEVGGKLVYQNKYTKEASTIVKLVVNQQVPATLSNVVLIPGKYTADEPIMLTLYTGSFKVPIPVTANVPGIFVVVGKPYAYASYDKTNHTWSGKLFIPYMVKKNGNYQAEIAVRSLSIGGTQVVCNPSSFTVARPGVAECSFKFQGPKPGGSVTFAADIVVTGPDGTSAEREYSGEVSMISFGSAVGVVVTLYKAATSILALAGIVSMLVAMAGYVSTAVEERLGGVLPVFYEAGITAISVAVILTLIPIIYKGFYYLVLNSGLTGPGTSLYEVLSSTGVTNPGQFQKGFDALIGSMMSSYDSLFNTMLADFNVMFKAHFGAAVGRAAIGFIVSVSLIALAAALAPLKQGLATVLAGAGMFGTTVSISIMSSLSTLYMAGSFVPVAVYAAKVIVYVVAVLMLLALLAGTFLMLVPGILGVVGEEMVAASIGYLVVVPLLGPMFYALYVYAKENALAIVVRGEGAYINPLTLPSGDLLNVAFPWKDVLYMTMYMTLASAVIIGVLAVQAAVLARAGVFQGVGSAFMAVSRR